MFFSPYQYDGVGTTADEEAGSGTPPPQVQDWMGYPPIRQTSIASTCCATGGMPLTFTQEDFLVAQILTFQERQKCVNTIHNETIVSAINMNYLLWRKHKPMWVTHMWENPPKWNSSLLDICYVFWKGDVDLDLYFECSYCSAELSHNTMICIFDQ